MVHLPVSKESLMNNLFPEKMSELNRKKIQDEMAAIRLEEEAEKGRPKWLDKNLATLGDWMVDRGEKLRKRRAASKNGSSKLIQNAAR
jgi:hypothetical protein